MMSKVNGCKQSRVNMLIESPYMTFNMMAIVMFILSVTVNEIFGSEMAATLT